MRHRVSGYKLGRKTGSRKALYRILLSECIKRGKITTTMSKAKATTALGQIQIQQIDGNGEAVETWTLWNAWIKDVKYGELDYDGDEMTDVEIELRYDWAYLETNRPGTQGTNAFFTPGSSS